MKNQAIDLGKIYFKTYFKGLCLRYIKNSYTFILRRQNENIGPKVKENIWVVNKYRPKGSTLLVHMQMKAIKSCHYTSLSWLRFRRLTTPRALKIVEPLDLPDLAAGNVKIHNHFGKQLVSFLKLYIFPSVRCLVFTLENWKYMYTQIWSNCGR